MRYLFLLVAAFLCSEEIELKQERELGWFGGEYVYLWMKNSPAPPPLVVAGPNVDLYAPVLGNPNTHIVLGDKSISNGARSGGKFNGGVWFDANDNFGLEGSYLFLSKHTHTKKVASNGLQGSPCLTFVFYNPETESESSAIIAEENLYSVNAYLKVKNSMQYAECNALFKVLKNEKGSDLEVFTGFFWWNFKESLTFYVNSPTVNPPIDIFVTNDQFKAFNNFFGAQIGLNGSYLWDRWFLDASVDAAFGAMIGNLHAKGEFSTNNFDGYTNPQSFPAGYLAMATNSGSRSHAAFSVIPKANINLGYSVVDEVDLYIGYTFLYATKVMYASNQIDRVINPSEAPAISGDPSIIPVGVKRPQFLLDTNKFWVQGINVGLNIHF